MDTRTICLLLWPEKGNLRKELTHKMEENKFEIEFEKNQQKQQTTKTNQTKLIQCLLYSTAIYFLTIVMSSFTPCNIQHSLKLLLVQECIDYKAASDLHHIVHRHLFWVTKPFLHTVQLRTAGDHETDSV